MCYGKAHIFFAHICA